VQEREYRCVRRCAPPSRASVQLAAAPKAAPKPLDIGSVTPLGPTSLRIPPQQAEQRGAPHAESITELSERIRFKIAACTALRAMCLSVGRQPEQRVNLGLLGVPFQNVEDPESVPPGQLRTGRRTPSCRISARAASSTVRAFTGDRAKQASTSGRSLRNMRRPCRIEGPWATTRRAATSRAFLSCSPSTLSAQPSCSGPLTANSGTKATSRGTSRRADAV
jgi:hypothetical protein